MTTRSRHQPTLFDRLSRLTPAQAAPLLGRRSRELLREGGCLEISIDEHVQLEPEQLRVRVDGAEVTVVREPRARAGIELRCSACSGPCRHGAAVISLLLEEKTALGLATPPPERARAADLTPAELEADALAARAERACRERMTVRSLDPRRPWTDYEVTSRESGRRYRVALRGLERGRSYCSCPDFRKNTLGTCKHVLRVEATARRRFPTRRLARPPAREDFALSVHYGETRSLRLALPTRPLDTRVRRLVAPLVDRDLRDGADLLRRVQRLQALGETVRIHPDAEELLGSNASASAWRR